MDTPGSWWNVPKIGDPAQQPVKRGTRKPYSRRLQPCITWHHALGMVMAAPLPSVWRAAALSHCPSGALSTSLTLQ